MMSTDRPLDSTIAALEDIVARCAADGDRRGYFTAMYLAVTRTVRQRCGAGVFEDGPRMERFVAAFAERYLDAERHRRAGQPVTASWQAAFEAGGRWRPTILAHLLMGMNAHINLDLGIVAAEIGAGALHAVQADFDAVNDVLGELVDGCENALGAVSPWIALVDHIGGRDDEALIRFSLARARRHAWSVATRLEPLSGGARTSAIDGVDEATARLARRIAHPGLWASAVLLLVRLRERARPAEVMALLAAVMPDQPV